MKKVGKFLLFMTSVNMAGKKSPAETGLLQPKISGSLDVGSLLAFGALRDFELNFLTFFQGLEAVHLNLREVRKQIFTAVVRSDKAVAF
jgi:hypothetical protein